MGPASGKVDPETRSHGPRFARGSRYRGTPNPGNSPGPATDQPRREGRGRPGGEARVSSVLEAGQRVRPSARPGDGTPGGNRYDRLRVMRVDPYPNRVTPKGAGSQYGPSEARIPDPMRAGPAGSERRGRQR